MKAHRAFNDNSNRHGSKQDQAISFQPNITPIKEDKSEDSFALRLVSSKKSRSRKSPPKSPSKASLRLSKNFGSFKYSKKLRKMNESSIDELISKTYQDSEQPKPKVSKVENRLAFSLKGGFRKNLVLENVIKQSSKHE
jgi:hypothetical protein